MDDIFVTERDLKELDKLEEWLKTNKYFYRRIDKPGQVIEYADGVKRLIDDRHQLKVYRNERDMKDDLSIWDVICQFGSYGAEHGLLEIMGCPVDEPPWGDDVEGYLRAEDIIYLIENDKKEKEELARVQGVQEL